MPAKGWILVFFICVATRRFLIVAGHLGIEDDFEGYFFISPLFPPRSLGKLTVYTEGI